SRYAAGARMCRATGTTTPPKAGRLWTWTFDPAGKDPTHPRPLKNRLHFVFLFATIPWGRSTRLLRGSTLDRRSHLMRWHSRLTLALLFLLGVATSLWANAGPRFVPPMPPAAPKLVVEVDEKATDAKLVIPRQFLLRRAELENAEPQEKQK